MLAAGIGGYLLATVTAIWVARVAEQPVGGASGIDLAAVAAYGVVFSKRTERLFAFIPLRPRTIAALFVVLAFVAPLVRQEPWPIVLPWAGAVSIALIVTLQPWRRMGDSGKLHKRRRRAKPRHLKVVKPDRDLLN
jgi:membrane associated rhomboid family serine protease